MQVFRPAKASTVILPNNSYISSTRKNKSYISSTSLIIFYPTRRIFLQQVLLLNFTQQGVSFFNKSYYILPNKSYISSASLIIFYPTDKAYICSTSLTFLHKLYISNKYLYIYEKSCVFLLRSLICLQTVLYSLKQVFWSARARHTVMRGFLAT